MFTNKHNQITKMKYMKKIPQLIILYFLVSQLLFGIDVGFSKIIKSKKVQRSANILTVLMGLFSIIILLAPMPDLYNDFWFWTTALEYAIYLLILHTTKYTVYDCIRDIHRVKDVTHSQRFFHRIIAVKYAVFIFSLKIFAVVARCSHADKSYCPTHRFPQYALYSLPALGEQFFVLTQIIVIYYFYCCVKSLKKSLESGVCLSIVEFRYLAVVECYDKIKPVTDKLVSFLFYLILWNSDLYKY